MNIDSKKAKEKYAESVAIVSEVANALRGKVFYPNGDSLTYSGRDGKLKTISRKELEMHKENVDDVIKELKESEKIFQRIANAKF